MLPKGWHGIQHQQATTTSNDTSDDASSTQNKRGMEMSRRKDEICYVSDMQLQILIFKQMQHQKQHALHYYISKSFLNVEYAFSLIQNIPYRLKFNETWMNLHHMPNNNNHLGNRRLLVQATISILYSILNEWNLISKLYLEFELSVYSNVCTTHPKYAPSMTRVANYRDMGTIEPPIFLKSYWDWF